MSPETLPAHSPPTGRAWLGDALLAVSVAVFWRYRYGPIGPNFHADTAVMGAMALRPLTPESFYYWGQDRLGALIPFLARWPVHWFGTDAAGTTQAIAYACAGVMVFAFLRLFRSLPWKLALAAFLAFPSIQLGMWMLDPSQPGPLAGTSAALQLLAFLCALRRPTSSRVAIAAFLAGFTLWAGENCALFFPAEVVVVAVLGCRCLKEGQQTQLARVARATVTGLTPALVLLVLSKHFSYRVQAYYRLRHLEDALQVFTHLEVQLRDLAGPGTWLYPLAGVLALLAAAELWRWSQGRVSELKPWALIGTAPLLCFAVTSSTDWFRANSYEPRYLAFGVVAAAVSSGLLLESGLNRLGPGLRRVAVPGAALAFAWAWIASPLTLRSELSSRAAARWHEKTALALEAGCQGLIGDYWQSYPYLTLSEGVILATPHEQARVRSRSVADEVVRRPVVCVVPWSAPLDECPPELTQFEARLTLRDRYEGKVGDELIVLCRYNSSLASNGG